MENNQIEIFGGGNRCSTKRTTHGLSITANTKHSNVHMTHDLAKKLFGSDVQEGKINIVHSKIENNWYVAATADSLFNEGFQCVPAKAEKISVYRINGAMSVIKKMIVSLTGEDKGIRYVIKASENAIDYDGMKLYKLTIQK